MTADVASLLADLKAEHEDLASVVSRLPERDWSRPTPAERWTIRDQICHLAFFDCVARVAITDRQRFERVREHAVADVDGFVDDALHEADGMPGRDVVQWWRAQHEAMQQSMRSAQPGERVPWFGPPMSVASMATARLMETWAHGQDVVDALGISRAPTPRLHHVAHLGVRTMANSFVARGRKPPTTPVRVELVGPGGEAWSWGEASAHNRVRGPALDFCLVVTQRRHLHDTDLEVRGATAARWLAIAQAFAGPPGPGRTPTGS